MDTTVIHDIGLHYLIAIGSHHIRQSPTEEVITDVSQVQRLIGIRRRIFNHHKRRVFICLSDTIFCIGMDAVQEFNPAIRSNSEIQETFYCIEICHQFRCVLLQIFTDFLCCRFRSLLTHLQEREHNKSQMTFKFLLGLLKLYHLFRYFLTIKCIQCRNHRCGQFLFDIHNLSAYFQLNCKDSGFL